jgi:ribosomal protein S18 acetylase RimI-like enzyme
VNDLTIRQATLDDARLVARLFSDFNAVLGVDGLPEEESYEPEIIEVSEAQMRERLRRMQGIELVFLAETPEAPVGLCCLRLIPYIGQDEPYAEVTQLYVLGEHQRFGIGAELLRFAEERARSEGATCVRIITSQNNEDAQAFYRSHGYRSDEIVFDKYFTQEIVVSEEEASGV